MLLVLFIGHGFYLSFFRLGLSGAHALPALLTLVPCFLFVLGLGAMAGRVHIGVLCALMLACMLLMQFALPAWMDFTGTAYYAGTPMTLPVGADGEPGFVVQGGFLMARIVLALLGIAGLWMSLRKTKKIIVCTRR